MATLLDKGQALMTRLLAKSAPVAVTYRRPGPPMIEIEITKESGAATVGRTVFSSNRIDAARIEFGDRDYLILASVLPFGEPREGDRIVEQVDDVQYPEFGKFLIYEIMPTDTGEPAWRWSDPYRQRYRIHVKLVKSGSDNR